MRPRLTAVALFLLTAAAPVLADLRSDVERLIRSTDLGSAKVAVHVIDAKSGRERAATNEGLPMIPASNQKLLTTGAALHVLGPEFQFRTSMRLDGDQLWIIGDGDPGFGDPDLLEEMADGGLDVDQLLALLVDPIAESALSELSEVIVDDRVFDREYVHETWPRDQLHRWYCAEVGGVNFQLNVLHFFPEPGGARPIIDTFTPYAKWITIVNRGKCDPGEKNLVNITRTPGTNEFIFHGNVKTVHRSPQKVTIHDPPLAFGRLLGERIEERGLRVNNVRLAEDDDPEPKTLGSPIGPVVATPLATAVRRCNADSHNLYAECILKRTAYERTRQAGSWLGGASVVRHVLSERIPDARVVTGVAVADGSGMSRDNRVTAQLLTAWLRSFHLDDELGPVFVESLAIAGETGTLRPGKRPKLTPKALRGARVQAKTGFINGVSTLSGYVTHEDQVVCFSILTNDLPTRSHTPRAKKLQEQIVAAIVDDIERR